MYVCIYLILLNSHPSQMVLDTYILHLIHKELCFLLIDFDLEYYKDYKLSLKVEDNKLSGYLDNKVVLEFTDNSDVLENGAMGLIVEDGTMVTDEVIVE